MMTVSLEDLWKKVCKVYPATERVSSLAKANAPFYEIEEAYAVWNAWEKSCQCVFHKPHDRTITRIEDVNG